ncbi:hypothetical protein H2198_008296 [Neophaeococcomyces mojaviensis]|uniref:Uncharacterized protein n=1 Tax=Neophaeococcomyces mojaviensis TaxID=3383035 RepID=A0ACC2ZXN4_9EURO|nr:hypothetical protein H2198_008296 [Knufia sp. JES_112]
MAQQCGFKGNPDIYGLGIRLGIYLQWAALQVTPCLNLKDESDNLYGSYLIFTIAIVIGMFVMTFKDQIHAIEVIIMLYQLFGGLLCVADFGSLSGRTMNFRLPRTWQILSFLLAWTLASGYGGWFYLLGKSSGHFVHDHCNPLVFLFVKVSPEVFDR